MKNAGISERLNTDIPISGSLLTENDVIYETLNSSRLGDRGKGIVV